jgi:hypothetical protein
VVVAVVQGQAVPRKGSGPATMLRGPHTRGPQDGAGAAVLLDVLLDLQAGDADLVRHLRGAPRGMVKR